MKLNHYLVAGLFMGLLTMCCAYLQAATAAETTVNASPPSSNATTDAALDAAKNPQFEARLKALSAELRCLVCQNSTLADSDAPLAEDLRNEIRTLMHAGKSDAEITDYLVARYGNFVRYRPPVNAETAVLWFGPFIMLLIGAITLFLLLKKRAKAASAD